MLDRRYRVLAVATHPVQYMSPLFRRMAAHSALDFHAAYCTLRGAEVSQDSEFGTKIQWDVPLLDGYSWSQVANRGSGSEALFGLFNPGLWRLIRNGNYDAVLCYVSYVRASFWIAFLASKRSNAAFLFGADATSLTPRDGSSWKIGLKKVLWPRLFRLSDQVIVPSSGSRDLMISLGIPSELVTLTPYSVDNDWWMSESRKVDRAAVRESWGVSPGATVVVFSAKLQQWKHPLDILRAFAKAGMANGLLVFAGEGPLRQQLEAEAKTLGVSARVRFLGFVNQSQLPGVYTASDLLVLPSEFEPFGVVVNEAMCCGCAAAASSNVGAARDLIAPVDPELVFPFGDIEALSRILRKAASDRSWLHEIAQASLKQVQTWSPERNIASTVDAVVRAVSRRQGTASRSAACAEPGPAVVARSPDKQ